MLYIKYNLHLHWKIMGSIEKKILIVFTSAHQRRTEETLLDDSEECLHSRPNKVILYLLLYAI